MFKLCMPSVPFASEALFSDLSYIPCITNSSMDALYTMSSL